MDNLKNEDLKMKDENKIMPNTDTKDHFYLPGETFTKLERISKRYQVNYSEVIDDAVRFLEHYLLSINAFEVTDDNDEILCLDCAYDRAKYIH